MDTGFRSVRRRRRPGHRQVIDGVTMAPGDRVLVKNQSARGLNGVYRISKGGNVGTFRSRFAEQAGRLIPGDIYQPIPKGGNVAKSKKRATPKLTAAARRRRTIQRIELEDAIRGELVSKAKERLGHEGPYGTGRLRASIERLREQSRRRSAETMQGIAADAHARARGDGTFETRDLPGDLSRVDESRKVDMSSDPFAFFDEPGFPIQPAGLPSTAEIKSAASAGNIEPLLDLMKYLFPHGHPDFGGKLVGQLKLHDDKNHDYASGGRALGNFERVSVWLGQYPGLKLADPRVVTMVYAAKQIDAVLWGLSQDIEHRVEGLDPRLDDVSTYATIVQCLNDDRKSGK
jgi:hypothetical protein